MTSEPFSKLDLPADQIANLDTLGYATMTPIQAEALPVALAGKDVIAQAKTGSGKTAVFGLAMLAKLELAGRETQAIVLCPTRELSIQVATEIRRLARHRQNVTVTNLYGGQAIDLQRRSLRNGSHIVVGTPGRIQDHAAQGSLDLKAITTLVFDEADRMMEMGFGTEIEAIVGKIPPTRQTLLFSATFPANIEKLSRKYQKNPERITVDERHATGHIEQTVYACEPKQKLEFLKSLLRHHQPELAVVFCNFKDSTRVVAHFLKKNDIAALALHGDLEQRDREEILAQFKHHSTRVLVATDVAARGLDIKDLPLVINYEMPKNAETYVHRIGRTGRAGKSGKALSLCSEREGRKLAEVEAYLDTTFTPVELRDTKFKQRDVPPAPFVTFYISGGRKAKLRPGEILGVLTAKDGLDGSEVGKIDVMDFTTYVAVRRGVASRADRILRNNKIKGRTYKVQEL